MRLNTQDMVREFMQVGGQATPERPTRPTCELTELRATLLEEELDELYEAMCEGNLVHAAKELADLLYVVLGTAVSLGIDLGPVFDLVHESNMAKFPYCEGLVDVAGYCGDDDTCPFQPHQYVRRRADGKVLKPAGWTGPEEAIKDELRRQFKDAIVDCPDCPHPTQEPYTASEMRRYRNNL